VPHANARLTPWARRELVRRVEELGWPPATVAEQFGVSRATVYKWLGRWRTEGAAGLTDRSSRPRRCPTRTTASAEAAIVELRTTRRLGPARIGPLVGMPPSTVHRVLVRHRVNRLAWMDRPTGRVVRRYEVERPGQLVHVDTKQLARVPDGGGWKLKGRGPRTAQQRRTRVGYEHVHAAVDDHTRLAYVEIHATNNGPDSAAFLTRAIAWFADRGITVEAVMTDNHFSYVNSNHFQQALQTAHVRHVRIPPRRPQVNGKVERFNRTLLEEWAYQQLFTLNQDRRDALRPWLHDYNHHRAHTALGGRSPIDRVNNLAGHYS
jgi:transposase InsO family protein